MTQKGPFDINQSEALQTVIPSSIIHLNISFPINLRIKQSMKAKVSKSFFKIEEKDIKWNFNMVGMLAMKLVLQIDNGGNKKTTRKNLVLWLGFCGKIKWVISSFSTMLSKDKWNKDWLLIG